jgi:tripartite ATP-independent transporter DctM subunit
MALELAVLFGTMLGTMLIGVPIFLGMALACAAYVAWFWPKVPAMVVAQSFVQGLDSYQFVAIIFFFLAGEVMTVGGIGERLLRFMRACFGHVRGGLSHVNIGANMVFSGVSGSALADASAVGSIMIPAMKRDGYDPAYAAAVTASAATMGPIIPPSIPMVIYGLFAMTSIGHLFIAGIVPGVLMGLFLLAASVIVCRRRNYPKGAWAGWGEVARSAVVAAPALLLPFVVVLGLVAGIATVAEIGAVAAVYAIGVSALVYRELGAAALWRALRKTGIESAKLLIIVSIAGLFVWIVGNMGVAKAMAQYIGSLTRDPILVLALIALAMVILGTALDPVTLFVVFVPLLVPLARDIGIDLVHLGVVSVLSTMFGLISPPVGLLYYLTAAQAETSSDAVVRELTPFLIALLLQMAVVVAFPEVTLWLPRMLLGGS